MKPVLPGILNLVRSENPGVAFGMFSEGTGPWHAPALAAFSIVAIVILVTMLWKTGIAWIVWSAAGLSLIFGGAVGNVYDRVRVGAVTDFLDFYMHGYHWYTFNLADSAICLGAGLLLVRAFFTRSHQEAKT